MEGGGALSKHRPCLDVHRAVLRCVEGFDPSYALIILLSKPTLTYVCAEPSARALFFAERSVMLLFSFVLGASSLSLHVVESCSLPLTSRLPRLGDVSLVNIGPPPRKLPSRPHFPPPTLLQHTRNSLPSGHRTPRQVCHVDTVGKNADCPRRGFGARRLYSNHFRRLRLASSDLGSIQARHEGDMPARSAVRVLSRSSTVDSLTLCS
jgi:hypothetical protein